MESESNMYKMWRSKQHTVFFGTWAQVGRYSGLDSPDETCPNCRRRETTEHLLICPDIDKTQLLAESIEDLSTWLSQDHLTDLELAYWIPKYILMRGDKPFASHSAMSQWMKALAISQDKIERKNFMEGCIFAHFFFIKHYHLALLGSYLNSSNWTKSLISKLLHITHLQWIYQNFTLHNKLCGYLHKKKAEDICLTIEELTDTPPEEVPKESKFLLEMNFSKLTKSHIKNQQYWIIAFQAAITAGRQTADAIRRAKHI
jgi:hypothetical protein